MRHKVYSIQKLLLDGQRNNFTFQNHLQFIGEFFLPFRTQNIPKKVKSYREQIIAKAAFLLRERQALMDEYFRRFIEQNDTNFVKPFLRFVFYLIFVAIELFNHLEQSSSLKRCNLNTFRGVFGDTQINVAAEQFPNFELLESLGKIVQGEMFFHIIFGDLVQNMPALISSQDCSEVHYKAFEFVSEDEDQA